ncbi:ATP-grasp domain-containing protein [Candidatus Gracilibacteria bacterium]|nr:ATP-grasp domain-containing protein [Candidatus Gracilibacteria bacterium]
MNQSKRVLFVGYRGKQAHIEPVRLAGITLFLLIEEKEMKDEYLSLFENVFTVKDSFDWKEILSVIKDFQFDGVLTRYEDFIEQTSALAEYFGAKGIDFKNSVNFRNKYLMKKAFVASGVPSADFALISSFDEVAPFLEKHSFPLILKQISGIHSKFVTKVNSPEDLKKTLFDFQKQLPQSSDNLQKKFSNYPKSTETPNPLTHFLLEECVVGMELTIDTFVVGSEMFFTPICRYILPEEVGIDDVCLPIRIMPCDLNAEEEKFILKIVEKGLRALGADYCATHTEVFYDRGKGEAHIIEIAARGGGFRAEMCEAARGDDYNLVVVNAALGIQPQLSEKHLAYAAVVEVFSPRNGKLAKIDYSVLKNQKDISHLTINKKIDEEVGLARNGKSFIVKFLLKADNYESARRRSIEFLNEVRKTIVVK